MSTVGIWWITADETAIAEIVEATLTVRRSELGRGYVWLLRERATNHLIGSGAANSEIDPYPTMEAAMDAAENYYVREYHSHDLDDEP